MLQIQRDCELVAKLYKVVPKGGHYVMALSLVPDKIMLKTMAQKFAGSVGLHA